MVMSSPASTHLLPSAAAAVLLIPRYTSVLRLSCAAGGAVARRRRRSGRLEVVRAASAEMAPPAAAAAAAYTTDSLILYFKAEGTMEERAIPKITQALEAVEGVSDLEVLIEEGIGSVVVSTFVVIPRVTLSNKLSNSSQRRKVSPKGLTFARCAVVASSATSLAVRSVALVGKRHTGWLCFIAIFMALWLPLLSL